MLPGGPPRPPCPPGPGWTEVGIASWYGNPYHGRTTASGEVYDMEARTGAHRTLPFGTRLRVDNLDNGRTATLTINDRGPFVEARILDVSRRIARELDMLGPGTAQVRITVLEAPGPSRCWMVQIGAYERERDARDYGIVSTPRACGPESRPPATGSFASSWGPSRWRRRPGG
jgi:rare lipoprotein A